MLESFAVRSELPHLGESQQIVAGIRRREAGGCWLSSLCGRGLLAMGAVRLSHPHSGDSQQVVAGILRCEARGCWNRALCGPSSLTAAILSKFLPESFAVRPGVAGFGRRAARAPHSGDSQQRAPSLPPRTFPIRLLPVYLAANGQGSDTHGEHKPNGIRRNQWITGVWGPILHSGCTLLRRQRSTLLRG